MIAALFYHRFAPARVPVGVVQHIGRPR